MIQEKEDFKREIKDSKKNWKLKIVISKMRTKLEGTQEQTNQ